MLPEDVTLQLPENFPPIPLKALNHPPEAKPAPSRDPPGKVLKLFYSALFSHPEEESKTPDPAVLHILQPLHPKKSHTGLYRLPKGTNDCQTRRVSGGR